MIKRYEVPDPIKADPNGELVAYLDYKEALGGRGEFVCG